LCGDSGERKAEEKREELKAASEFSFSKGEEVI